MLEEQITNIKKPFNLFKFKTTGHLKLFILFILFSFSKRLVVEQVNQNTLKIRKKCFIIKLKEALLGILSFKTLDVNNCFNPSKHISIHFIFKSFYVLSFRKD